MTPTDFDKEALRIAETTSGILMSHPVGTLRYAHASHDLVLQGSAEPVAWKIIHRHKGVTTVFSTHHPEEIQQYLDRPDRYEVITGYARPQLPPEQQEPVADVWRCVSCGFEDISCLRDGVNNHWRKGYVPGLRPTSAEAICYSELKRISLPPAEPLVLDLKLTCSEKEELQRLRKVLTVAQQIGNAAVLENVTLRQGLTQLCAENAALKETAEHWLQKAHELQTAHESTASSFSELGLKYHTVEAELAALRKQVPEGYVVVPREYVKHFDYCPASVGGICNDKCGLSKRLAAAQGEPAHTDHPLRHWDRTCPGCIAENQVAPNDKESDSDGR